MALEPQAFALLAAIAVFPMTDSRLTLYAAAQLSRSERWTNVLETLVCQVSRLPWLRQGRLPEWLRAALVEWLERRENEALADTIRALWLQLLERDSDDTARSRDGGATSDPLRLEFVRTHAKAVGEKRMKQVVDKDRKGYEERVLLAFLTQTPVRQVVFEAPTDWRDLAPRRWTALEAIVVGIGVVVAAAMVGWSGVLKAWLLLVDEKVHLKLVADATLTAVGLSFLVVFASYLRQFEPWSRLLNGTAIAIFSAATAIPGIALLGIAASHGRMTPEDTAVRTFLILLAPIFSYAILWLGSSSSLRFPAYDPLTSLFLRWPISCAVAMTIVVFTLSLAITFAVHAVAFDDAAWRLEESTLSPFPRFLFGSSGIFVVALALVCGLYISLARLVDVSVSKAMLVVVALVHLFSGFGCVAIISVVGMSSLQSDYGGVAVVVMIAVTICAPLAVARWRSLDGSAVRFTYCLIGIALALEIAKAAVAGLMGGWNDRIAALAWFVPALVPAYLIAHRLVLQPRLPASTVRDMLLVAGALLMMGVLAMLTVVPLVGSDIQDAILTSTPALTVGLEAGGFLLALRYGRLDRPIGLPGPAARASEVLVPLFRAVWPILALVPATLGFALLGAEMKANHYGSTDFGRASFTVAFDNGSTTLPKSADQTLQEAAAAIKAPENRLVVTGYADRDTPSSAEQRLAEGRATVVRDALVARGVPKRRDHGTSLSGTAGFQQRPRRDRRFATGRTGSNAGPGNAGTISATAAAGAAADGAQQEIGWSVGRRLKIPGSQGPLHQHGVEPAAELEADVLQRSDHLETARGMELDRRRLCGIADHRHHLALAERRALLDQHRQERLADTLADGVLVDVDRILDREFICRPRPPFAGIGIAQDAALKLGHEMRQADVEHGGATARHLGKVGRIDLEGGRAVQHVMGVDFGAARHIGLGRGPHDQLAHLTLSPHVLHAGVIARSPSAATFVLEQRIGQLQAGLHV